MMSTEDQRSQQATAQMGYTQSQQSNPYVTGERTQSLPDNVRPMTVDDVVTKTAISLGVIILGAIATYYLAVGNPQLGMILSMVGAIGGLITVMVSAFSKKFASRTITLIYSAFEGLFVGGISFAFANVYVSEVSAGMLLTQAIVGTIGVFIGMLFVYKSGAIRVTPRFNRMMIGALIGVLILSVVNLIAALVTVGAFNPLRDGGPIAIVFSLVMIGLAALSFLSDFDLADRLIRAGAPADQAWGVALGLSVTLVWLYTEILRLLSYANRN